MTARVQRVNRRDAGAPADKLARVIAEAREAASRNTSREARGFELVADGGGRTRTARYGNGVEFPVVWDDELARERENGPALRAEEAKRRKECFADGFRAYSRATFGSLPADFDANAAGIARSYADGFGMARETGGGLLLFGTSGTGKTHLAACVCNALLSRHRCKMTTLQALEDDHYRINASLRRLLENDLVVIDDLGSERTTETGRNNTFTVFSKLVGDGRPFIVTTCLDPARTLQLDQARKRAMGRVLQCCKAVEVAGPDRRLARMPGQMVA